MDAWSDLSDAELVRRVNDGDERAFEALYLRHRDWAAGVAHRLTGSQDDALDILQESFLWLLKQFPGFTLRAPLKAVLYRVIRNTAIARGRRAQVRADHAGEVVVRASSRADATQEAFPPLRAEGLEALRRVLRDLSEQHREIVFLRFVDDLELSEIATALDIPVGTVKSRLHHALRAIRDAPAAKNLYFE